jgi:hypothetical protein
VVFKWALLAIAVAILPLGGLLLTNGLYHKLLKRLEVAHPDAWRALGSPTYLSATPGPALATLRALFAGSFAALSPEMALLARRTRHSLLATGALLVVALVVLATLPWLVRH